MNVKLYNNHIILLICKLLRLNIVTTPTSGDYPIEFFQVK